MHVFQGILCCFLAFHPNSVEFDTAQTGLVQDFFSKIIFERELGFQLNTFY